MALKRSYLGLNANLLWIYNNDPAGYVLLKLLIEMYFHALRVVFRDVKTVTKVV